MSIKVAVRVDEQGQLQIPDEIQQQLFPGMVVVLTLEEQSEPSNGVNGHPESVPTPMGLKLVENGPELVEKGDWTVIRGKLPSDFDWDSLLSEDRERRLDQLIGWAKQ
ncbi:MAG: hypothetical protein HY328_11005 [Chloroflexi bacterium]|nr:hypothetical protein [Chloroflexota bacterium]